MIDKRIDTVEQALDGLSDGASIMIGGFGGSGLPVTLVRALEETSARDLTVILISLRFIELYAPRLIAERRIVKGICTAARSPGKAQSKYERQIEEGSLELELTPQGTFAERLRAGGAGVAAFYTPTGVGTLLAEGKEVREFDGQQCLLETGLKADFALIRGNVADRWGNVSFRGTQRNFCLAMATAARTTAVEVDTIETAPLSPEAIDIPGIFTQRVIALPDGRSL
ncbi:MAG: 3-oxoacid CoA-transferase subunit A [Rhodospirillaceae bacterium]|jgi:3-oxoadipate CoA-transferase, alpha subunit|nr:3-oxoacid CoA-transferase subunit A [Rhodospirillaceae bacterium]MBT5667896.1 3-oxoacid CoA-transferase subunit A [Rhodospirillaceae bacterium]MBT5812005.1 3-oxoacid CoA-transferase subunit A [Rhodospirillaceae bacterium]